MADEACHMCRFFRPRLTNLERDDEDQDGDCRRRSPSPELESRSYMLNVLLDMHWQAFGGKGTSYIRVDDYARIGDGIDKNRAEWPLVASFDWCGDFDRC